MEQPDSIQDPTSRLVAQHVGWTRALAGRLVRDAGLADDLAQEALRITLERPPRHGTPLRRWIGRVLRNLCYEEHRATSNREERERARAQPEAQPAADDLVQHVHAQRMIADALLTVREPFRSTLLLRYYEELPPRAIARKQGIPVATVKSRLARGLSSLRTALDESTDGDRRAWKAAIAPLAFSGRLEGSAGSDGLFAGLKVAAASGVAATVVYFGSTSWMDLDEQPTGENDPATNEVARVSGSPSDQVSPVPMSAVRSSPSGILEFERLEPSAFGDLERDENRTSPVSSVRGRVLDQEGLPVAGLTVRIVGEEASARSGAMGNFEIEPRNDRGSLTVTENGWVTVRRGYWSKLSQLAPVLVVARAVHISGQVIDSRGRGVEGARVNLRAPSDLSARVGAVLDSSLHETWSTVSRAEGRFTIERAPAIPGSALDVHRRSHVPVSAIAPTSDTSNLIIELPTSAVDSQNSITGIVLRADGSPATRARIAAGTASTFANSSGRFALDLTGAGEVAEITAVEAGSLAGRWDFDAPLSRSDHAPLHDIEIRLGSQPLVIRGTVVSEDGTPQGGARVWITGGTEFGYVGRVPLSVEALAAGALIPAEAFDSLHFDESHYGSATPWGTSDAMLSYVETSDDGSFEIGGLNDRSYRIGALGAALSWATESAPVPAGRLDARIIAPTRDVYDVVAGTVRTHSGTPLRGVTVTPFIAVYDVERQTHHGKTNIKRFSLGTPTVTDENGSFVLTGVPTEHVQLHLIADDIVPAYTSLEDLEDPRNVVVSVLARIHLDVDCASLHERLDRDLSMSVVDGDGSALPILEMRADGYTTREVHHLLRGRSGVVSITSDARALVLLHGDDVVETIPLQPRPGQTIYISR